MDCPPRFSTPRTPERPTLGTYAANIAVALGTPLMSWQQHVLDVALEIDPATGRLAYQRVILTVPRQSGKTQLSLALILLRALGDFGMPRQQIRYTAQTGSAARQKFMDEWWSALKATPFHQLYRERATNGHEALIFKNGSHVGLVATTQKSGHGGTLDLAILDEAFAHPDARLEQALLPAMNTRMSAPSIGAQLWIISTAGTHDQSPFLWHQVQVGREAATEGLNNRVAYFDWSAPDDADPGDPEVWRACMPALGHTTTEETIQAAYDGMELAEFRRAFLNQWTVQKADPIIPLDQWQALAVEAEEGIAGSVALSFDVTPDNSWSAIAGASALGSLDHLDVIDHHRGTDWLIPRLSALVADHNVSAVVYDPSSPAAAIAAAVEDQRLKSKLVAASARDFGEACQMLQTGVSDQTVGHAGQPELLAALDGAGKKPVGDLWRWSRTSTSVDISPLVAVTLALWGHRTHKPQAVKFQDLGLDIDALVASARVQQAEPAGASNPYYSFKPL